MRSRAAARRVPADTVSASAREDVSQGGPLDEPLAGSLVLGVRVEHVVVEFPPRCPGDRCAVCAYCVARVSRLAYESL